jgi:cell division protein FtsN
MPSRVRLTPDMNIETGKNYRLQVGSFKNAKNAVDAFDRLKNSGLNPAYERFTAADNSEYYRVVVAGISGVDVQLTTEKINAAGFKEAIIREEN